MITTGQRTDRNTLSARILTDLTRRLGGIEQSRDAYSGHDAYMQWGFKLTPGLQYAIDHNLPYVIVDWGYFSDRETSISISFNGFHGLSMPVEDVKNRPARWHPAPRPWRPEKGEFVYVFGQLQNDRAVRGLHVESWLRETAVAAATAYGLTAKIRPHPKTVSSWERPLPSLETVLDECRVAVTYTSSAGIITALAGIPTVVAHPASPAFPVRSRFGELDTPPRKEWLHDLSWRNYSIKDLHEAALYVKLGLSQALVEAMTGEVDTEGLRV